MAELTTRGVIMRTTLKLGRFGCAASILVAVAWGLAGARPARGEGVALLERPAYPLYTIGSKRVELSAEDVRLLAGNFQFYHGKFGAEQEAAIRRLNPAFKSLTYINSTYTRSPEDVGVAEARYRSSLCMLLAGKLDGAIGAEQVRFTVVAAVDRRGRAEAIPVRASTVAGDFSSTRPAAPSTKHFVMWVRVGDELMRVDAFDAATGRIDVTRGFSGTKAAAHAGGARVFSPVYLGYNRALRGKAGGGDDADDPPIEAGAKDKYPGQHPGGPGDHLRYVLDPAVAAGWQWKADQVLEAMGAGADGVWLDTFNCGTFNLCDCLGRKARPWDFARERVYAYDDFRLNQERKVAFIQRFIREKLGRFPFLVANNLGGYYEVGSGGMKLLLMPTEVKPRPLDGFCMEGALSLHDLRGWVERMRVLAGASQAGLAAMPILGGAGAKSALGEADTPSRDRAERFGYASYLLAVEKGGRTMMGTYAFYQAGGKPSVKLHPMYYFPIGDPARTVKPADFEQYRAAGSQVYRRAFTNGVVLVNPSEKGEDVDVGGAMLDPDTGRVVTAVTMAPGTGKILLNRAAATAEGK